MCHVGDAAWPALLADRAGGGSIEPAVWGEGAGARLSGASPKMQTARRNEKTVIIAR
jgi:hypothetical protein